MSSPFWVVDGRKGRPLGRLSIRGSMTSKLTLDHGIARRVMSG